MEVVGHMSVVPGSNAAGGAGRTKPATPRGDGKRQRRNENDIALRHGGARLPGLRVSAYRNRGMSGSSALTLPATTPESLGEDEESDPAGLRVAEPAPSGSRARPQSTVPSAAKPRRKPAAESLPRQLDRWLAGHDDELIAIRRHLHAHPELSGQEFATAALVER